MKPIYLDAVHHNLSINEVVLAARGENGFYPHISLGIEAEQRLLDHRRGVELAIQAKKIMYGVNTGVGSKKGVVVPERDILLYQKHYIRAHSTGIGEPFAPEVVRAAMVLRVNSFTKGNSGISLELCRSILQLYNHNIIPVVPQQGSVGSSGDLAPLAHLGAALIGLPEQNVWYNGQCMPAPEALKLANIEPIQLGAKEAMGLTNGATFSLALTILDYVDALHLFGMANLVMALSLEAIRGEMNAFDSRIHEARNHLGQILVAKDIRSFLAGSQWVTEETRNKKLNGENKENDFPPKPRVQDAYSFRCHAQVAGSVYQVLEYTRSILEAEINASTDNPLVFKVEGKDDNFDVLSGGNFHGEPIAHAADFLKIAVQSLANISNSRFYALLSSHTSYGLPNDLAGPSNREVNTGLMILQYSVASIVSENKVLCHPASVDSIPTSAGQEDYVSMAPIAARHLRQVVENTYKVVAAELIAACQGISLVQETLDNPSLGKVTAKVYHSFRQLVPMIDDDQFLHTIWQQAISFLKTYKSK